MFQISRFGFYNRDGIIHTILQAQPGKLYTIIGEAGIGKSRLLEEACRQLRDQEKAVHIIQVDLSGLGDAEGPRLFLPLIQEIARQMPPGSSAGIDAMEAERAAELSGEIVRQAVQLSEKGGYLLLILDTTDRFQLNTSFWSWLEENLIGPLLLESQTRIIFSGRMPAPLNRWEVRRSIELIPVGPLSCETDAAELAREVLAGGKTPSTQAEQGEDAVRLILSFSFGHPELTILLAETLAETKPIKIDHDLKKRICTEVIQPFINENFFAEFEDIDKKWVRILWLASILNWFDAEILQRYLRHVAPELGNETEWFYIEGIKALRTRKTVVWHEAKGDRLRGVIRDIVSQCLKYTDEQTYRQAREAAQATFQEIAQEFSTEQDVAVVYEKESAQFA